MLYFSTRQAARNFAKGRKVVDLMAKDAKLADVFKVAAGMSKRWAVKVV